jgi:hypothetical protein
VRAALGQGAYDLARERLVALAPALDPLAYEVERVRLRLATDPVEGSADLAHLGERHPEAAGTLQVLLAGR